LKSAEPEEVEQAGEAPEEPVLKDEEPDDLPAWLAGLDEKETPAEPPATTAGEDLPDWLRGVDEEQAPVHPEPTASTDWQPADFEAPASEEPLEEATPEPEPVMEEPAAQEEPPAVSEPLSELELQSSIPPEREPYQEPVTQSRSGMTGMLSSAQDTVLNQAQLELTRGNVSGALENYEKLIRKGKMLDEIIFDLREALYRYPVDVSILQSLGDAYMRANRLQDALDAYTKAEELLR
jgi:tetratricopeptide (TPR) repeat protein